jgi:hypothetical protein
MLYLYQMFNFLIYQLLKKSPKISLYDVHFRLNCIPLKFL